MIPVSKICAKARVEQFPGDFNAEENILFCKFCLHSVDIFRVDTVILCWLQHQLWSYKYLSHCPKIYTEPVSSIIFCPPPLLENSKAI